MNEFHIGIANGDVEPTDTESSTKFESVAVFWPFLTPF